MTAAQRRAIARRITKAASFLPQQKPDGLVNISSWVGVGTPEWYSVFSYSSPEPCRHEPDGCVFTEPWFCSLDLEAQCFVLLLVGQAMETQ